ncbi:1581_t:CDS:2 [Entrophospora sp. SA101]|nr:1581_t:CDS:2 [Entrophospora sp. SA101]
MQEERRSELRKDKEKLEKAMNDWKDSPPYNKTNYPAEGDKNYLRNN